MFNLFKKEKENNNDGNHLSLISVAALLIHSAKIDENFTEKEKDIIKKALIEMGANKDNLDEIIRDAELKEKDSNQILEFTQKVKKMDINTKRRVVEFLWRIILSDNTSDVYESNLMRRICGLLYLPDKLSGEIKLDIIKQKKNDIHS